MARVDVPPIAQSVPERAARRILDAWGSWDAYLGDVREWTKGELATRERKAFVDRKNAEIQAGLASFDDPFAGA